MKRSIFKKVILSGVKVLAALALTLNFALDAQGAVESDVVQPSQPLSVQETLAAIESITASYQPWKSVEYSGKLKYDKLPISPTVKMYMVCDSLIQISVRVPLMGEVGRIELTPQRVLAVNKMKRVYVEESAAGMLGKYPGGISDLQSLFLARVVFPGSGELSTENPVVALISEVSDSEWMLMPVNDGADLPGFSYGYLVGKEGRTHALVASYKSEGSAEIIYGYENRGLQLDFNLEFNGKKPIQAELDFNSVKWGGAQMTPLRTSSYRRVGFREFLSSM
ncbi:MAG: DUF4292 domain-containing protein [Muribaculaceae bacterium]|nr:DUF4292 domain-containing protein [Muribaculaceae bacterium]